MISKNLKGKELLYVLDQNVEAGWLSRQKHSTLPLFIYCYTPETQYKQHWTDITKFARGVVLDTNGEVVSKSFSKFFNFAEPCAPHPPKYCDYLSFEKLDGSLLNLWYYEKKWHCSTKGSFSNPYTEYGFSQLEKCLTEHLAKDLTLITEVILPEGQDEMRRAVQHEAGLYFLGATHTPTLKDLNPTMFYGLWNGHFPELYRNSVDELLQQSNSTEGTEGWVVRYSNGLRLKIKTVWYLRLFRMISRLDSTVKEQILAGQGLDDILKDVPEELQEEIKTLHFDICKNVAEHQETIKKLYELNVCKNRKTFAQRVCKDPYRAYLFKMYDGKDIEPMLLKAVVNGDFS